MKRTETRFMCDLNGREKVLLMLAFVSVMTENESTIQKFKWTVAQLEMCTKSIWMPQHYKLQIVYMLKNVGCSHVCVCAHRTFKACIWWNQVGQVLIHQADVDGDDLSRIQTNRSIATAICRKFNNCTSVLWPLLSTINVNELLLNETCYFHFS